MGARSDLKLILAQNFPAYLLSFSQSSSVTLAIKITDVFVRDCIYHGFKFS